MTLEELCFIKKIVEKKGNFEFYKIGQEHNPLNECYYVCNGYRLLCDNKEPITIKQLEIKCMR